MSTRGRARSAEAQRVALTDALRAVLRLPGALPAVNTTPGVRALVWKALPDLKPKQR